MEKATGQSLAFVVPPKNVKFFKTDEYPLLPTAWMKSASCFSATKNIWRPEISLRGYQIIPRSVDLVYSCNYIPQNVQFYILILLVFVSGESIFCSRVFELLRNLCNPLGINWLNLIVCELHDLYFSVCWCIELNCAFGFARQNRFSWTLGIPLHMPPVCFILVPHMQLLIGMEEQWRWGLPPLNACFAIQILLAAEYLDVDWVEIQ